MDSQQKSMTKAEPAQLARDDNHQRAVARHVKFDAARNPVFDDYADLARFSERMLLAEVLPSHIKTGPRFELIFLMLQRLGVNALNSMKSTWVNKNGTIEVFGNVPLAACRAHPDFENIEEYVVNDKYERRDDKNFLNFKAAGAVCVVTRKGQTPTMRMFSVTQAASAGLLNKAGPWQQYQDRMLTMRARTIALRDAFTDVFEGVAIREMDEFVEAGDADGARGAALPKGREQASVKAKQFAAPRKPAVVVDADAYRRASENQDTPERSAARAAFEGEKMGKATELQHGELILDDKMIELGYGDEQDEENAQSRSVDNDID